VTPGFLGSGWAFPLRFDPRTRALVMSEGVEDIEESLRILLSTHPGERIMQPAYGCAIRRFAFESMSDHVLTEMRELIRRAVLFHEPRILLESVETEVLDATSGQLLLRLNYRVRSTNTSHNLVFPYYLRGSAGSVGEP